LQKSIGDKKWSKILHRSFDRRQVGDYDDWVEIKSDEAKELLDDAGEFVDWTQKWLTERNFLDK